MPPPRPLRSDQIPQASDLARVRWVLSAISEGEHATAALAERANVTPRQVSYAIAAARILGWLGGPEGLSLTSSGMALLSTAPGTDAERSAYRRAITASEPISQIAPDLLTQQGPSVEELSARILSRTVLSEPTARRRAQTLLAWRAQAIQTAGVDETRIRAVKSPAALPEMRLPVDLERDLRRNNPWWEGRAGVLLPPTRRDFVGTIHRRLSYRLAPIVAVRGPRQVGKTVAQLQLIDDLLRRGVPPTHILRVQCDEIPALPALLEPILRVVDWYEEAVLGKTLNAAAHAGEPTYLFFDEVQNLPSWAIQLKFLVDSTTTQVVVTGSSGSLLDQGLARLPGRVTTVVLDAAGSETRSAHLLA